MPQKPRSLRIATVLLLGFGVAFGLALLLAPFDLLLYTVNDQPMRGLQFAHSVGLPIALMVVSFCAGGWALWRNRSWSRPALLASAGSLGVLSTWLQTMKAGVGIVGPHLLATPLLVGIATWYLYFASKPKTYYSALRDQSRTSGA